jgi:hypothetical protein
MQRETVIARTLLLTGLLLAVTCLHAQSNRQEPASISEFVLVNLHARKPVPNQHLIIFVGSTVVQARGHSRRIDLQTNADGIVSLVVPSGVLWFQAWREVTKPCQKELRDNEVWHGNVLFDEGIIVMDTCGAGLERLQPYFPNLPSVVHVPTKPN